MSRNAIRDEPLQLARVMTAVSHPGAGAVVTFTGLVRDHHDGKAVTALEYEAYESMAQTELAAVREQIEAEIPGVRLAVEHRVGRLEVGEFAVVCAASAPHREQAFVACRALIDRIKERVPIWKKEYGPDGSHWVGWDQTGPDAEPEPPKNGR